jgi:hypothetical protein
MFAIPQSPDKVVKKEKKRRRLGSCLFVDTVQNLSMTSFTFFTLCLLDLVDYVVVFTDYDVDHIDYDDHQDKEVTQMRVAWGPLRAPHPHWFQCALIDCD